MTITPVTSNRVFSFNGKKYIVVDVPKTDRKTEKEKYQLAFYNKDGLNNLLYNVLDWEAPKFQTIREAQQYVHTWDFLLDTM